MAAMFPYLDGSLWFAVTQRLCGDLELGPDWVEGVPDNLGWGLEGEGKREKERERERERERESW